MNAKNRNKRIFYRLNTMVPLSFRVLSEQEARQEPAPNLPDSQYIERHFLDNLQETERELQQAINAIAERSDLLASALHALNNKINVALQTLDRKQLAHMLPLVRVNMSAGGLALETDRDIKETDKVDLLMQPNPNEPPILIRSHVVNILPLPDKGPNRKRVALEFENLPEEIRRRLIYFIQQKELEQAQIERAKQQID